MPVTSPIADDTALLVVDLQQGTAANPFADPIGPVASHAGALAAAFRERGLPVVLLTFAMSRPASGDTPERAEPEGFRDPLPDLDPQPDDIRLTRTTWGAFTGSDLHRILTDRGVSRLVLAGVATSIGVESTAREARDLGYRLVIAADATTDLRKETYENSITRIFPLLAEVATTAEIVDAIG